MSSKAHTVAFANPPFFWDPLYPPPQKRGKWSTPPPKKKKKIVRPSKLFKFFIVRDLF